jgi:hypothetical protein
VSFREVIEALGRQWRVLVVGVVTTGLFGWLAAHPQPTFKAVTVIALQPPQTPLHPNKLTDLRPSVALTAAMVTRRLESEAGDAGLRSNGVRGTYEIAPRNSGTRQTPAYSIPSVEMSVTAHDSATAFNSVERLASAFDAELAALQREWAVAAEDLITVTVLAPPTAQALLPVKSRALVGAALLGTIGTAMAALWFDRRRARPDRHGVHGRLRASRRFA